LKPLYSILSIRLKLSQLSYGQEKD